MTRLKKLFPLSFAFCKSPVKLFLGILLYLVLNAVAIGIVNSIITALMAPLAIFLIPYIGWILALICIVPIIIYITVLDWVVTYVAAMLNIYTYAGIAISFVAYAKYEKPVTAVEAVEEVAAIEEAETVEEAEAE